MERTTASLSAIEEQDGINSEKCTPGIFVGILLKGPPVGLPGFGSQVSNCDGPPQSQSSMQCFCLRLAISANAGTEKRPDQLKADIAPAVIPSRNFRLTVLSPGNKYARLEFNTDSVVFVPRTHSPVVPVPFP